jgi:hypothetical protein
LVVLIPPLSYTLPQRDGIQMWRPAYLRGKAAVNHGDDPGGGALAA